MVGFFLKKWFFDMWDNLLGVVIYNLGFVALLAATYYVPALAAGVSGGFFAVAIAVMILIITIYSGAVSQVMWEVAEYRRPTFAVFRSALKKFVGRYVILGVLWVIQLVIAFVVLPFYWAMGNIWGMTAVGILFWISVGFVISSQYFLPLLAQTQTKTPLVLLRKSLMLFLDNFGFTVLLTIGTVAIFGISVFVAFMMPGAAAVLLWHQVGTKLRLYKYDYLEEQGTEGDRAARRRIPWSALLLDEKERVGKRTFRGMIFPWKD